MVMAVYTSTVVLAVPIDPPVARLLMALVVFMVAPLFTSSDAVIVPRVMLVLVAVRVPAMVVVAVALDIFRLVAVVLAMFRATAVAVSRFGVRMPLSPLAVPEIQKVELSWATAYWFWM